MQSTDIAARVRQALADLGPDPDTIADRLRQLGVKGYRSEECHCVLAVYLQRALDPAWIVEVLETSVRVLPGDGVSGPAEPVGVPLPEHVTWFVQRFDKGAYPDLVEGAS